MKNTVWAAVLPVVLCLLAVAGTAVAGETIGVVRTMSGDASELAPGKARFETPSATIGIRGTRFAVKVGEPSSR